MMEENNGIFLASGDALVHLAGPMQKKYSRTFSRAIHLVRTYLMNYFSTLPPPSPLYAHVHI